MREQCGGAEKVPKVRPCGTAANFGVDQSFCFRGSFAMFAVGPQIGDHLAPRWIGSASVESRGKFEPNQPNSKLHAAGFCPRSLRKKLRSRVIASRRSSTISVQ